MVVLKMNRVEKYKEKREEIKKESCELDVLLKKQDRLIRQLKFLNNEIIKCIENKG